MAETSNFLATKRYAVVTGANRGMGLEICRQLASHGITVVLTARDENKGVAALEKLKGSGLSKHVLFHHLDVAEPSSVASLADFINTQFGKLDILVNNAATTGYMLDESVRTSFIDGQGGIMEWSEAQSLMTQTHSMAEECLQINYYGAKRMVEELVPFLHLSDSARIVNMSSSLGKLKFVRNEWARGVFLDEESLTEERVEEVLKEFLKDFEEDELVAKNWPLRQSAYIVGKAALNAYTKILAKRYPSFIVNSVCPGYVKTDMNCGNGMLTIEQGAENAVRLALLPKDGPSGLFFLQKEVSSM